ncbi:hypothetical protein [Natrinema sp. 74]|uniref:hypothetical protein n=1 Tax=Natrinema sp. 74 TaxID=3384159 RepID=UPI0038D46885
MRDFVIDVGLDSGRIRDEGSVSLVEKDPQLPESVLERRRTGAQPPAYMAVYRLTGAGSALLIQRAERLAVLCDFRGSGVAES